MIAGTEKVNSKLSKKVMDQGKIIQKQQKEIEDARNQFEEAKLKINKQQEDPECPLLPNKSQ